MCSRMQFAVAYLYAQLPDRSGQAWLASACGYMCAVEGGGASNLSEALCRNINTSIGYKFL